MGQREQLALIGTLPYAALIAARRERRDVPPVLAFLIGAGAAVVFALKHYFLVVPLLLELWLLVELPRQWRWRRPETIAMISVGAAYAAAIVIWASDYFTRIVPLARLAYGMLRPPHLGYLFGPFAVLGLVSLGLVAAHHAPSGESRGAGRHRTYRRRFRVRRDLLHPGQGLDLSRYPSAWLRIARPPGAPG
jgi:hypothetical protein